MKDLKMHLMSAAMVALAATMAAGVQAAPQTKVTICHKFGTPAEGTLTVGYPAVVAHVREHGDFLGACPQYDQYVDVDGILSALSGVPTYINVKVGDPLTSWPTGFGMEGLDWFDNDGTCTWTMGDDLHLEDPAGACATAFRDGLHDLGLDCPVLDIDGSFFQGQQVDVDLESGTTFTGCPGPDPLLKFHDLNGNGLYDDAEDIVLDLNGNGVFD